MKKSISTYSLWMSIILLFVVNCLGTYEYFFNMPKWFADPPVSFEVIRQQAETAQKIWIPIQALFLGSIITSIITNWRLKKIRTMIVYAGLAYLFIIVTTIAYFAPEVVSFMNVPMDAPKTDELINRVDIWYRISIFRNLLQLLALIFVVNAALKKTGFKRASI